MKVKNYIMSIVFFFACPISMAQIPLDTVFISSKKVFVSETKIRYYYLPNLQAYFDTQKKLYIYKQNGNWITSENIPSGYRGYCLKNSYYVMINGYSGEEPYMFFEEHKKTYPADYSSKRKSKDTVLSN